MTTISLTPQQRTVLQTLSERLSDESVDLQIKIDTAYEYLLKQYKYDGLESVVNEDEYGNRPDPDEPNAKDWILKDMWEDRYLAALTKQIEAQKEYATALADRLAIINAVLKIHGDD